MLIRSGIPRGGDTASRLWLKLSAMGFEVSHEVVFVMMVVALSAVPRAVCATPAGGRWVGSRNYHTVFILSLSGVTLV